MTVTEVEPGGRRQYDGDGNPIVDLATCGHCGRTWDDAIITSLTPVPSGRCPFEYEHGYNDEEDMEAAEIARQAIREAGGLVGRPELEERWNVSRARIAQLTKAPGFPEPVGKIGQSPVWLADEVDAWRNG